MFLFLPSTMATLSALKSGPCPITTSKGERELTLTSSPQTHNRDLDAVDFSRVSDKTSVSLRHELSLRFVSV